ncbi:glycosyltransferase family 2 protein [Streptomyces bathyalis]|uniref:Glycosyltransferase family 2 protein n=1 Tax=Streptomyces bathyalis TaxID=2710756 RepID=A0A7T1T2M5_9ACTN|nr:glycosyltransferase family 2 protein [Streptomyces bathyalis]QPP05267.1 glycosyltransferase family 2 protein [Streptomyces bathyalis]
MVRSVTVIIPAHDEEEGLPATLESVLSQSVPPEQVIVVDDASRDRTGDVARRYGVSVLRPPQNLGSKARAQNYALPHCSGELVLAVDADTVLARDYIERILPAFDDPEVVVAAGNVQTRFARTVWERGRSVEYLFGFHWHANFGPVGAAGDNQRLRRSDALWCHFSDVQVRPSVASLNRPHADLMLTFLMDRQLLGPRPNRPLSGRTGECLEALGRIPGLDDVTWKNERPGHIASVVVGRMWDLLAASSASRITPPGPG